MNFKGKQVLITGGAGFLGSFLTEEMLRQGARVTIFDRLSHGTARIQHLLNDPALQLVKATLQEHDKLSEALPGTDFVWHLAANADIPGGIKNTMMDISDGILATRNLLEAMRNSGVCKIAFASSGAVYGEKTSGFRSEKAGPTLPISLYGAAKLGCEGLISAYSHLFNLHAWIFRFGNVISGRITHGVILDFINKLRKNSGELEVLGDGTQTKSYLLSEECLAGMQHVIEYTPLREGVGFCDCFNIGAQDETLVLDIAKMVIEEMKLKDCKIKIKGGERGWLGDQAKIALDISKVKSMGWAPRHSSGEAVRIAIRRMLDQSEELYAHGQ